MTIRQALGNSAPLLLRLAIQPREQDYMVHPGNPVGRLFNILEQVRVEPDRKLTRDVWAEFFGLDPKDTGDVLLVISQLLELVQAAKESIRRLDGIDHSIYLRPFENVEQAFAAASLGTIWKTFKDKLDDATMVSLRFGADTLSRTYDEQVLDSEILSGLQAEVEDLLEKVVDSELEATLKTVMVDHLEAIRRSILGYRLWGSSGLKTALETSIGAMLRHKEELGKTRDRAIVARFLEVLQHIDRVVAVALKAKQLFAPVVTYLLGPGSNGAE
jgi:hypothetical protein